MSALNDAEQILKRAVNLSRLVVSIEAHLLADQRDAVAAGISGGGSTSGGAISDPTPGMVRLLAPYADYQRRMYSAMRAVDNALDQAERTFSGVLGENTKAEPAHAEPRCPGWTEELRAQVGGCGKVLETYRANGVDQIRGTWLCVGCRKAKERAARAEEAA